MAKRTIIKKRPDGSTEITTQGCLGRAIGYIVLFWLAAYVIFGPATSLPWWQAVLVYLGMLGALALLIWGGVWAKRKEKAKAAAAAQATAARPQVPRPASATPALSTELTKLAVLHQSGALSDAEFQAAKSRLIGQ